MGLIKELFKDTSDLIEIREISQNEKDIKQFFFNNKSIKEYKPPTNKNIYFGVHSRAYRSGKAEACNDTKALWCDIDNLKSSSVSERIKEAKERIASAKLPEASILVSSGNGLHCYWLLSERASNSIVEVNRAIASAIGGDMKATDKARILRLPNTNTFTFLHKKKRIGF